MQALQRLKRANGILTLEALTSTAAQESALAAASEAWSVQRITKLKNVPIEWDKQGKHIPGNRTFNPDSIKSVWTHPDPQGLLKRYAGKGKKVRGILGEAGFKERVDFGEIVGYYVNAENGVKIPTSKAIIHYSKNGAHIVPSKPK